MWSGISQSFHQIHDLEVFSPFHWVVFSLSWWLSFAAQKFLNLTYFFFVTCAFVTLRNHCLTQVHEDVFSCVLLKFCGFRYSKSVFHFELIFGYSMGIVCGWLHPFPCRYSVVPASFLAKILLFQLDCFTTLSKRNLSQCIWLFSHSLSIHLPLPYSSSPFSLLFKILCSMSVFHCKARFCFEYLKGWY